MRSLTRLLLLAGPGALVLVGAGAAVARLGGPDPFGKDLPQLGHMYLEEARRGEALSARDRTMLRCLQAKNEVVDEVVAGRMTLAQAVDRFRELRGELEDGQDEVVGSHPLPDDEEALSRNVISWVRAQLRDRPATAAAVEARLRAEQEEMRAQRGRPAL